MHYREIKYLRKSRRTILKRRRALKQLARAVKRKHHRTWPEYGSARQLQKGLLKTTGEQLSVRHVQRELHNCNLRAFKRPTAPTRKIGELAAKRRFARKHRHLSWRKIIFSDETWLTCNEMTGNVMWCEHRSQVLPRERKQRWNVASVMVWACVGYNFKSPIVILPSKVSEDGVVKSFRLDAQTYIRRCLSTVMQQITDSGRIFQQDGARSHVAKATRAYLARKKVQWFDDWPSYSPDMNMIEGIWKVLGELVGLHCPMTQLELVTAIRIAWNELPQNVINSYCKHWSDVIDRFSLRH
jgi:hypothetical protein